MARLPLLIALSLTAPLASAQTSELFLTSWQDTQAYVVQNGQIIRQFQRTLTDDGPALVVGDTIKMYGQTTGSLGREIVFRVVNGRTIVSTPPVQNGEPSDAQKAARERFIDAVHYAKEVMLDADLKSEYGAKAVANGKGNAFSSAIADFLNAPEILSVDITGYFGNPDDICVDAIGELDTDANAGNNTADPAENIAWPDPPGGADGTYECWVHNWEERSDGTTAFTLTIQVDGQQEVHTGNLSDDEESTHYFFSKGSASQ